MFRFKKVCEKCELNVSHCGVVVGTKWTHLIISKIADILGFSPKTISRASYRMVQNKTKKLIKKHQMSGSSVDENVLMVRTTQVSTLRNHDTQKGMIEFTTLH